MQTTLTPTTTVDELLALGRRGELGPFVTGATAVLSQGEPHDELRFLLMRRLAEVGLLRRAAALGEGLSESVRQQPAFAALRRQLAATRHDGQIAWSRFNQPFEANLAAAREHRDFADDVAAAWRAERRFLELHQTAHGLYQVFDRRIDREGGWRPRFANHVPQPPAAELAAQLNGRIPPAMAIEGIGLGHHLPWLHAATANTFLGASAVLYQIEPSWLGVAVAFHLSDWRALLADERVRFCLGPEAFDVLAKIIEDDMTNAPPQAVVRAGLWGPPPNGTGLTPLLEKLGARVQARCMTLREAVETKYAGRDRRWWQQRYRDAVHGNAPPLRVLGVTCRFTTVLQYSMRDTIRAFDALGCPTRLLIEPSNHARLTPETILSTIRDFEPDLVLMIDHTRAGQRDGVTDNIPFVTWIQDRLPWLCDRQTGEAMGPLDFCMGFGRNELSEGYGYPADQFLECKMATDPAVFFDEGVDIEAVLAGDGPLEPDSPYACDVAFATNRGRAPDAVHNEFRTHCDAGMQRLIDAMYEELIALAQHGDLNGGLDKYAYLDRSAAALGIQLGPPQREPLVNTFIHPIVDQLIRRQTIEWTARWADATGHVFRLYGNGWDTHPTFSTYAAGYLKHGPELGRAVRAARVNLHAGCNNAMHQRVLDGLAAGGFLLLRRHAVDYSDRSARPVNEALCEGRVKPGDTVCWPEVLPPPANEWYVAVRKMMGTDPFVEETITPEHVASARAVSERSDVQMASLRVWPDLDAVTFGSADELAGQLQRFLTNEEERRETARRMRQRMLEAFGHQALMRRLCEWMVEALGPA